MSYFQRSISFFKFLYLATVKILTLKGDLVLATSTPLTIGIPALIKKWIHKTTFIFEVRDVWPEAVIAIGAVKNKIFQKILYFLEHLIYKNANALVPLSIDMKQSIVSRYPKFTKKPIVVIENISEISRFQNFTKSETSLLIKKIGFKPRFTILYAGTFGKVNGIGYLIEFASKLAHYDPSIVFVLIGDGIEKNKLINDAKNKKVLNKNVFFLNSVSKEKLPQLYFECDMGSSFVLPIKELWANSANKFFDTLAAGKPVLINYKGWQKNVINRKQIGYVLSISINNKMIKKFLKYSKKKLFILSQQKKALNVAKEYYAKEKALAKYNILLQKIYKNV